MYTLKNVAVGVHAPAAPPGHCLQCMEHLIGCLCVPTQRAHTVILN